MTSLEPRESLDEEVKRLREETVALKQEFDKCHEDRCAKWKERDKLRAEAQRLREEYKELGETLASVRKGLRDRCDELAAAEKERDQLKARVEELEKERDDWEETAMDTAKELAEALSRLKTCTEALEKIAKNKTDDCEIYTMGCDCDEEASQALAGTAPQPGKDGT